MYQWEHAESGRKEQWQTYIKPTVHPVGQTSEPIVVVGVFTQSVHKGQQRQPLSKANVAKQHQV